MSKYIYAIPPAFDIADRNLVSRRRYHLLSESGERTLCNKKVTEKWKKVSLPEKPEESALCWRCVQLGEIASQEDFDTSSLPAPPNGYVPIYKLYRVKNAEIKFQYMMHFCSSESPESTICTQGVEPEWELKRSNKKIPVKMCSKCARSSFYIQKYLACSDSSK